MISKVTRRVAQALIALNTFSDWPILEEWLLKEKESLYKKMIVETDVVSIHQYQGALLFLESFLEKKAQAQKIFDNFK